MTLTHWKKLTNPDYLGAYAMESGKDMVLTIKSVALEKVIGADGKKEECTVIHFAEPVKPMICNVTNAKTIQKIYKTPFIEEWRGRKIQIYVAEVKAFGDVVDAIRIRPIIPKAAEEIKAICSECSAKIEDHEGATGIQIANATYKKFGKVLCLACVEVEKNKLKAAEIEDPLNEVDNADS